MDYSAWRITFQSAEQAARSAFARVNYLHGGNVMLQSECERLNEALDRMRRSRDFYMRRCEALQAVQDKMRDPERKAVCDILANGETYVYASEQGANDALSRADVNPQPNKNSDSASA